MARVRRQVDAEAGPAAIREAKLSRLRLRAREIAEIVVRLPADPTERPGSEARAELLGRFGLTAAWGVEWMTDPVAFVAETTCHSAWLHNGEPWFIRDEHYKPSAAEVSEIAAAALAEARKAEPPSSRER